MVVTDTNSQQLVNMTDMQGQAGDAVRLLKGFAHTTRFLILCQLWDRELSVGELNERIDVSQSVLSQHLAVLRVDGLVHTRRDAQAIFYRLVDPKATRVLELLRDLYCPHIHKNADDNHG